jgi:hypothetical protein
MLRVLIYALMASKEIPAWVQDRMTADGWSVFDR